MATHTSEDALNYLYSLIPKGIKLGLKNISNALDALDNPQQKSPTIHIAGTNGKGSTGAFCESILRNAGYRVGLYTSPHLINFSERIQIDRVPLTDTEVIKLIDSVKRIVEQKNIPITFFEFCTAMAFLHFSNQETDVNVIEVGMGGRLDATNLCKGDISIITSISKDHTAYLGNTIKKIAFEKASVIKKNGTVFASTMSKQVQGVIKRISDKKLAHAQFLGEHFYVDIDKSGKPYPSSITYRNPNIYLKNLEISLLGTFQASNAALALSACFHYALKTGRVISEKSIRDGLKKTSWAGRMEIVSSNPTVILDIAHNPAAVKEMAKSTQKLFSYTKLIVICGIMKDKQSNEILKELTNFADHFILVRPNQNRSENPARLKKILNNYKVSCEVIESIPKAIIKAKQNALPNEIICITGSIFTVGEAKQFLKNEPDIKTKLYSSTDIHSNG